MAKAHVYRIRRVDGHDDDIADEIRDLHCLTFAKTAPVADPEKGMWWIAYCGDTAVGFAGLEPSTLFPKSGYFSRVGVLHKHRGRGLQNRFMRAIEAQGRREGWKSIVSDTTQNPPSANCFVRRGWRTFSPEIVWSFAEAIYWRKVL